MATKSLDSSLLQALCISFLLSVHTAVAATRNAAPLAVRISCGSIRNTRDPRSNKVWFKDFGYTGGRYANATGTSYIAPALTTLRFFSLTDGPENCYNITRLRPGHYAVRLFFGLNEDVLADREPLFDVSVEGTQVASLTPGWSVNDDRSYVEASAFISDTAATVCFHSTGHGDPSVMSIEVLQLHPKAYNFGNDWAGEDVVLRTEMRLDCGENRGIFDNYDDPWGGDRYWAPDGSVDRTTAGTIGTSNRIRGASTAPNYYPERIYQSATRGRGVGEDLRYKFNVEGNRNYSVWLHFAEIENGVQREGQRVFNVLVNGQLLFWNVDIVRMARGPFAALVLNSTVAVHGRALEITFQPGKQSTALVSAIEIFDVVQMEQRTRKQEVWALRALKKTLGLPLRFGWNGDPCVPQQHPWSGINCRFDKKENAWFIDGLGLDSQGLKGFISDDIKNLQRLQSINLSGNSIYGTIPPALGTIDKLEILDLSHNMLNGTIPESFGDLNHLRKLYLNGNLLSGKVPVALDGLPIRGASFNFAENAGLCGVPGLPSCGPHLSSGAIAGIVIGVIIAVILITTCGTCMWKRRQNILRAQRLALREAPYAKARTNFIRDVQMSRPYTHDHLRTYTDPGPQLLA